MNRMSTGGGSLAKSGVFAGVVVALTLVSGCASSAPEVDWVEAFGYEPANVHAIELGAFGYPYVPVVVASTPVMLPFDTGNMAGLSVSSDLFDQLGLVASGSWNRYDSAGRMIAHLRTADAVPVAFLGRDLGTLPIRELDHPTLPGLIGPTVLRGGHFTLDYASRRIALGDGALPERVPGFRKVPLVRSARYPGLILVRGAIDGQPVLLECDTGKSRSVINPGLASSLSLKRGPRGVEIDELRIGDLSFAVPSAKEVDQRAIDPDLPEPIMVGVGSDILSRFVWTVDFDGGALWVPVSQASVDRAVS